VENVRVVKLPAELVERLDERAAAELRSRNNMAAWLVTQGLREPADEPKAAS
jgi:hypothetical protein